MRCIIPHGEVRKLSSLTISNVILPRNPLNDYYTPVLSNQWQKDVRTKRITWQSCDRFIKRHVSYKMAPGNVGTTLLYAVRWCLVLSGNDSRHEWCRFALPVVHYGTIRPSSHAYIMRSHVRFHRNTEECDKPQRSVPKQTLWLRTDMSHMRMLLLLVMVLPI